MNDKTMLELAARAAGIGGMHYPKGGWLINGSFDVWNPLTDDGDALRLAVKLRLDVEFHNEAAHRSEGVSALNYHCRFGTQGAGEHASMNCDDIGRATRRAITRAAAEIGKAMAEKGVG